MLCWHGSGASNGGIVEWRHAQSFYTGEYFFGIVTTFIFRFALPFLSNYYKHYSFDSYQSINFPKYHQFPLVSAVCVVTAGAVLLCCFAMMLTLDDDDDNAMHMCV